MERTPRSALIVTGDVAELQKRSGDAVKLTRIHRDRIPSTTSSRKGRYRRRRIRRRRDRRGGSR